MKEYKFRAKHLNDDNWCYGTGIIFGPKHSTIVSQMEHDYDNFNPLFNIIKPETLGQYTGLKDKNGVEIWEGDNIGFTNKYIWYQTQLIIMSYEGKTEDEIQFWLDEQKVHTIIVSMPDIYEALEVEEHYEVIGNIHTK